MEARRWVLTMMAALLERRPGLELRPYLATAKTPASGDIAATLIRAGLAHPYEGRGSRGRWVHAEAMMDTGNPAPRWLDRKALAENISVRVDQIPRLLRQGTLPQSYKHLGERIPRR